MRYANKKPAMVTAAYWSARLIAISAAAAAVWAAGVQPTPADRLITKGVLEWNNGSVAVSAQGAAAAANAAKQIESSGDKHLLIQFSESVTDTDKVALRRAGVELQTYVGDNAFFARVGASGIQEAALAGLGKLRAVQPIELHWKLDRSYVQGQVLDYAVARAEEQRPDAVNEDDWHALTLAEQIVPVAVRPTDWVAANVLMHPDSSVPENQRLVDAYGGVVRSTFSEPQGLTIEMPYGAFLGFVGEDAVMYAEPPLPGFSELNAENRASTGVNVANAPPYNLSGAGVTALIYDGGTVRVTHQDLAGHAANGAGDTSAVSDHSTHVSGTVGGNGTANINNRGMAPMTNLICYGFQQPGGLMQGFLYTDAGDLQADYAAAILNSGADVSNNSIGTNTSSNGYPCDWEGNYGLTSRLIDEIARGDNVATGSQPFRIVWANGNERQVSTCLGVEGWQSPFHSTAPPACAKNHLAIGALNENPATGTASFTSYGPSDDGRMKPDFSAPGVSVLSCSSSSDTAYATKSGTSMASPTVCGISSLILQDFRVQYPSLPDFRNSTLKTWLAHTAQDQVFTDDDRGPDYRYGYGLVNAQRAVDLMRSTNWLTGSLSQGQTYQFFVSVPGGSTELKVTLAWDDVPAAAQPVGTIVNDLDIRVFDAGNQQYFPWTLNTLNSQNPDAPPVRTQADHVNNIEQVVVDNPTPGVYRVEILGFNVPQGPQSFSCAATPQLINCTSAGIIGLSASRYNCTSTVGVQVVDCDLNTDDGTVQTVTVNVASTSDIAGISVLLTETDPVSSTFVGQIMLGNGVFGDLEVAHGDTITATYNDADTGGGQPATVTSNATVDCVAPQITSVSVSNVTPTRADVTIVTNEPATANVRYGTSCGNLNQQAGTTSLQTSRTITLSLNDQPTYFFAVDVADAAGNAATDNNGGSCYSFSQPVLTLPFSDDFNGTAIDFNRWAIVVGTTVDGVGLAEPSAPNSARFNGAGGVSGTPDEIQSQLIDLSPFGVARLTYWFQCRGGGESPDANEDLVFSYKNAAGQWIEVQRHLGSTTPDMTTYQQVQIDLPPAAMHAAFRLRIQAYGTSTGTANNDDWFVDDLSLTVAEAPTAFNVTAFTSDTAPVDIELNAADPTNQPLTYRVLSLPGTGSLSDPNGGAITTVPYTLLASGDTVRYSPVTGFGGAVQFTYNATDGQFDSNTATVTVNVEPILSLPFSDNFDAGTSFNANKWAENLNAVVDATGLAEPSAPNSARFNGHPTGGDNVSTQTINLANYSEATLRYSYERTGPGNSPEANEDLIIEYRNALNQWVEISRQLGSGVDMTTFAEVIVPLPAGALHGGFRLRIRNIGTLSATAFNDEWYVDNVEITGVQTFLPGDMNCDGTIGVGDIGAFVLALTDPTAYALAFPSCDINLGDLNNDDQVSVGDIGLFVALLTGG